MHGRREINPRGSASASLKSKRGAAPQPATLGASRLREYREASAELEAEVRSIGLWQACDVDDQELKSLRNAIQQKASHDLKVWVDAGMPQDTLLDLLARVASMPEDCVNATLETMRNRQALLKSLAKRMRTISVEATKLLEQPSSSADWWFCFHGGGLAIGEHPPRRPRDIANVSRALVGMKVLSEMLDNEQRRFGKYLRALGRVDPGIMQLLTSCWARRSALRKQAGEEHPLRFRLDHLEQLARLLRDAFECAGRPNQFSAAGLNQVFKRHVVRLLTLFLEEHISGS